MALVLTSHLKYLTHILPQPGEFVQRILVLICEMAVWHSQAKRSKAKTPALTKPGWCVVQRAYRMKCRREENIEKMHFRRRKQSLSKHID